MISPALIIVTYRRRSGHSRFQFANAECQNITQVSNETATVAATSNLDFRVITTLSTPTTAAGVLGKDRPSTSRIELNGTDAPVKHLLDQAGYKARALSFEDDITSAPSYAFVVAVPQNC
jgi:hypothetical protein